jgi:hypothetical protein
MSDEQESSFQVDAVETFAAREVLLKDGWHGVRDNKVEVFLDGTFGFLEDTVPACHVWGPRSSILAMRMVS